MAKKKIYFNNEAQQAIIDFNNTDSLSVKNKLFQDKIYPVFNKLCEAIIFKWKIMYYDTTITDLKNDTITELYSKLSGFNPEMGKAYSYFTKIAKNYLIQISQKNYKKIQEDNSLTIVDGERNLESEISEHNRRFDLKVFLNLFITHCEKNFDKLFTNKTEKKVVDGILSLLKNSNDLYIDNKKMVYILLREHSGVNTQSITRIIKKFKLYFMDEYHKFNSV